MLNTYPLFLKAATSTHIRDFEMENPKKAHNPIEAIFAKKLSERFPEKIKTFQKVVFNYHSYSPDIVYFDRKTNIFIDIEIDEPYSRSGSPTHFIDSPRDNVRNSEFVNNGWNVLRFSERQIIEYLPECIQIVDKIIYSCINKTPSELDSILRIVSDDRWTENESYIFQNQSLRDFYSYEIIPIQQNEASILLKFQSLDEYINEIVFRHLQNFDREKELIFMPHSITDIYKHIKDNYSLISIECFTSRRKKIINEIDTTLSGFGNPPKIKFFDFEHIDLFKFIQNKKMENLRIHVNDKSKEIEFYNFVLIGSMNDFWEKQLKLIPDF
jgi:hypothetical protein